MFYLMAQHLLTLNCTEESRYHQYQSIYTYLQVLMYMYKNCSPKCWLSQNPGSRWTRPTFLVVPKIRFLCSRQHLEKKELEVHWGAERITLNSYSLNWLPIVNTTSKIVRRKGELAPLLREERRGEVKVGRVWYDTASWMNRGAYGWISGMRLRGEECVEVGWAGVMG